MRFIPTFQIHEFSNCTMSQNKYWGNFGQLHQTESFKDSAEKEFKEDLLPLEDIDQGFNGKTPRRDFLKYLGFSTAAAALAASCEMPVRKAVPYLQRPDNVTPGVANLYASTFIDSGDAVSVVVKQRDGRPIKVEGNTLSSLTHGATSARVQASVLDLYDTTRLRHPLQLSGRDYKEVSTFDAMDNLVAKAMAGVSGKPVVLLTSTINSPSTLQVISQFLAKYPAGSRHIQYDAMSCSGMILANEASYGKRMIPSYRFDKARTIVSLGADFLGSWLSPVEFSKQYSMNRKVEGEKPTLSRHIQFESMMSLTGSNADDRFIHKPSQTGAVALAILSKLGGGVSAPSLTDANLNKGIDLAARALMANKGAALVVSGSNDVNVQIIVNAINEIIGANGTTVDFGATLNTRKGIDAEMYQLSADINNGNVGALLIQGCNPVYSFADGKKFGDLLAKVPVTVSFNSTMDETTELCKFVIPNHHWLESWGDAESRTGYYSMIQPVINPLFKTRPFQTSLIKWSGISVTAMPTPAPTKDSTSSTIPAPNAMAGTPSQGSNKNIGDEYENYLKKFWLSKLGSEDNWYKALQDGVIEPAAMGETGTVAPFNSASVNTAVAGISSVKGGETEVILYEKVTVGNGSQANNPWLQETPDPISKVTWDNYAMISPAMAKTLIGVDVTAANKSKKDADNYEVHPEKPVVKITINGKSVELPAMIIPGMHPNVIAVAVGYGRKSANADLSMDRIGRSASGTGQNAYPLLSVSGNTISFSSPCTVAKTGNVYALAQTQVHAFTEGRPVIYETNYASFIANPEKVLEEPREERALLTPGNSKDFEKDATLYPNFDKPGVKWGMSIDLNTCTGCSACVVACIAENNVSVVGKQEVARYHDMHWLRIDRYFTGDPSNPDVIFQPMLCQHCDNAPCENVCPVAATNHSSEGLNQMAYNRCIGTRYCANNCPYKVRRFNWLDYNGADSFKDNQRELIGNTTDEVIMQMNDDLTRMVLNPDVTVRSRGVMEKCTFCVQRLQEGKLEAKKHQDASIVRNLQTACAQACPTNAIMFGNINDRESEVWKIRNESQVNRSFYVLDQLHTLSNVNYLAKVRNTDRKIGAEMEHEEQGHNEKAHA